MRLIPALVLLVLSPFVGEYLLGNIPPDPLTWAFAFLPLVLLYGGGALLIREVARRLGRGYPTMVVLALAYALVEEGIVLGTLFNRDYLGLGLLEYGWIPQLGTSLVWAGYVVGIHTVWSILVPIVLVEHLFPARADRPWLKVPGTVAVSLVYLLGAALLAAGNFWTYRFWPSPAQLVVVAVLAVACVLLAVLLRPGRRTRPGRVPPPAVLAAAALALGTAHVLNLQVSPGAGATVVVMLLVALAAAVTFGVLGSRAAWTSAHTLGAVTGAVLSYGWIGFFIQFSVQGFSVAGLVSQLVFALLALGLVGLCWRRLAAAQPFSQRSSKRSSPTAR